MVKAQTVSPLPRQEHLQPFDPPGNIPRIEEQINNEIKLTLKNDPCNQPLQRTIKNDMLDDEFRYHKTGKKQ
jgi:hypothetical protein